ncbi:MAG: reverse transcriptase domain-containing protein, partial [Anaerolineae bacterium]
MTSQIPALKLTASNEELRDAFYALRTREDVAELLEIPDAHLRFYIYRAPQSRRYTPFRIPKKSGGSREIWAPSPSLKILQQKLNYILALVYEPKASVHGYVLNKSILTNARVHTRKRYVLNIDLKDFFPSINFGRVRGIFTAPPYNLNTDVATVLAQICCVTDSNLDRAYLPQGAPTSPIISNMICAKLDSQLRKLAESNKCDYTRYADDLTFSTTRPRFPAALAQTNESGIVELGDPLKAIIESNGFEINLAKVRLQTRYQRQEVTGLTTNVMPNVQRGYIREIRAILHAWERYGLEAVQARYEQKYLPSHLAPHRQPPSIAQVVRGKIEFLGMIRGKDNAMYIHFQQRLMKLCPGLVSVEKEIKPTPPLLIPELCTEGKTDRKHLEAAFKALKQKGLLHDLELTFWEPGENDKSGGDSQLLERCHRWSERHNSHPLICIFDRDNEKIMREVQGKDDSYKAWGNNVFSFTIPIPDHRANQQRICIEQFYQDKDIRRKDRNGRRIFLAEEFNKTAQHIDSA